MIFSSPAPQLGHCCMSMLKTPRQLRSGAGLGMRDEVGHVLVHQAVQSGLLRPVAFRSAAGRRPAPIGASGPWLARNTPEVMTSDGLKPCMASQSLSQTPTFGRLLRGSHLQETPSRSPAAQARPVGCQEAVSGQRQLMAGSTLSASRL